MLISIAEIQKRSSPSQGTAGGQLRGAPGHRERPALQSTLLFSATAADHEHVAAGRDDHRTLTFQKAYKATPQLTLCAEVKCAPGIATCAIIIAWSHRSVWTQSQICAPKSTPSVNDVPLDWKLTYTPTGADSGQYLIEDCVLTVTSHCCHDCEGVGRFRMVLCLDPRVLAIRRCDTVDCRSFLTAFSL